MIARLRRRFILIAMLSVFAVLFVIVGGINLAGALSDEQEASRLLDMLEQGGGVFPKPGRPLMRGPGGMTPETPYETRYFTVLFHGDGTVSAVNTGSIAAVTTGEAIEYAAEVLGRGRTATAASTGTASPTGATAASSFSSTARARSFRAEISS